MGAGWRCTPPHPAPGTPRPVLGIPAPSTRHPSTQRWGPITQRHPPALARTSSDAWEGAKPGCSSGMGVPSPPWVLLGWGCTTCSLSTPLHLHVRVPGGGRWHLSPSQPQDSKVTGRGVCLQVPCGGAGRMEGGTASPMAALRGVWVWGAAEGGGRSWGREGTPPSRP